MLVPKGKQLPKKQDATGANEGQPIGAVPSAAPAAQQAPPPEPAPKRASRPVTAADLLVRHDTPMVPIDQTTQKGARWTFRHPDADGSSYTGGVYLARVDRWLSAEEGYVTTGKADEREALKAMGWLLWHTEVPDARPVGFTRSE